MSNKKIEWETETYHYGDDEPVCPHCAKTIDPTDLRSQGEHEIDCEHCGKPVQVVVEYFVSYDTYKPKEESPNA